MADAGRFDLGMAGAAEQIETGIKATPFSRIHQINDKEADAQREDLFSIMAQMAGMQNGSPREQKEIAVKCSSVFARKIRAHFHTEELLMAARGMDGIAAHKEKHRKIELACDEAARIAAAGTSDLRDVLTRIKFSFVPHIMRDDAALRQNGRKQA